MQQPILRPTIHSAIIDKQSYEIIKSILDQGIDPNILDSKNNTALHFAVEQDRDNIVELLLDYKANVNMQHCDGDTPLHWAVYSDSHSEITENLINSGASPHIKNNEGLSSLDLAHNAFDITLVALIDDCLNGNLG